MPNVELIDPFGINSAINAHDYPEGKVFGGCSSGRFHCSGMPNPTGPNVSELAYQTCYYLDDKYEWKKYKSSLNEKRPVSACTSLFDSTGYWIVGGAGSASAKARKTSEILKSMEDSFDFGPVLPKDIEGTRRPCIAKINDSAYFLSGWYGQFRGELRFYIVNFDGLNASFSMIPQPQIDSTMAKGQGGCGSFTSSNLIDGSLDTFFIYAGGIDYLANGRDETVIYSIKSNSWIAGPKLPRRSGLFGYVSDQNFPLLLIGGCSYCNFNDHITLHNDIMSYNLESNTFEILPGRLSVARVHMAASIVHVYSL